MPFKKTVYLNPRPQGRQSKPKAPARGDIIHVDFSPAAGREMIDPHPALVISDSDYNIKFRFVTVLAITTVGNDARDNHFAVNLMGCGTKALGVVVADKPRSLDLDARRWQRVEAAPAHILDEAVAILAQTVGMPDW